MAGIIAGKQDKNNDDNWDAQDHEIWGVAPDASLYALKVCDAYGDCWESDVIAAIEKTLDPDQDGNFKDMVDVVNISLGGSGSPNDPDAQAVDNVVSAGIAVVVAAGNDYYYFSISCPGCAEKAITVGASDKDDFVAYFSSRGPLILGQIKPEVVAPGVDICSTKLGGMQTKHGCVDDRHVAYSGTSMATPHVAGLVALIRQAHPEWNPSMIKSALIANADPTKDNHFLGGHLSSSYEDYYFSTDEMCTQINIPSKIEQMLVENDFYRADWSEWKWTSEDIKDVVLRENQRNKPGNRKATSLWSARQETHDDYTYYQLTSSFDSVKQGKYWLCNRFNKMVDFPYGEGGYRVVDAFSDPDGGWKILKGSEADTIFWASYNTLSNVLTQGGGRVNALKAINSQVLFQPSTITLRSNQRATRLEIETEIDIQTENSNLPLTTFVIADEDQVSYHCKDNYWDLKGVFCYYNQDSAKTEIKAEISPKQLSSGINRLRFVFSSDTNQEISENIYHGYVSLIDAKGNRYRIPYVLYVDYTPSSIEDVSEGYFLSDKTSQKVVRWSTSDYARSYFHYRKAGDYTFSITESSGFRTNYVQHYVEVGDLPPGEYEYFISANYISGTSLIDNNNGQNYHVMVYPFDNPSLTANGFNKVTQLPPADYDPIFADLDNDGRGEIIYTTRKDKRITIFEQVRDNTFTAVHTLANKYNYPMVAGDADGDGLSELLVYSLKDERLVYEAEETSGFPIRVVSKLQDINCCQFAPKAIISDTDNDGKKEIITYTATYGEPDKTGLSIYENTADNSYELMYRFTTGGDPKFTIADFDNDGRSEIALANSRGYVYVLEAESNNSYRLEWSKRIPYLHEVDMVSQGGDLNGNGKNEFLIVANSQGTLEHPRPSVVYVFESTDNDKYHLIWTADMFYYNWYGSDIDTSDLNLNGQRDIAVALSGQSYIFEHVEDNAFVPIWFNNVEASFLALGDQDNDKKPEIFFSNGELYEFPSALTNPKTADIDKDGKITLLDYLLLKQRYGENIQTAEGQVRINSSLASLIIEHYGQSTDD